MNIPTALYNAPTTVPLGIIAGVAILVVAGVVAWKAGSVGLQQKLRTMLTAIGFAGTGIAMLATTVHLMLVQLTPAKDLPRVSMAAVSVQLMVVLVIGTALVAAVIKRMPIETAGAVWLLAMALAVYAELNQFRVYEDSWALGVTMAWAGVAITGLALVVTASVVGIKAYGRTQFELGQLAALDAKQQTVLDTRQPTVEVAREQQ